MSIAAIPSAVSTYAATLLLEIEAVHCRIDPPFTLTSGRQSPVYVDCRRIISFPAVRTVLTALLAQQLSAHEFDAVAGGETAGIPFAAFMATQLNLPMLYVRKQPKGFGRNAQIEGVVYEGQRVLLIEDMMTDGGSKEMFVTALRAAGAEVAHIGVMFQYGIFSHAAQNLTDLGVTLHGLCNWWDILRVAQAQQSFNEATLSAVERFLINPESWKP